MDCIFSVKKSSGLTLVNLLITLSILSLLTSTGVSVLSPIQRNIQANNAYQQLFTAIQFARIQAVNYRSQALLCPTNNEQECIDDWNQPLMIFIDTDNSESRNNNEPLLQIIRASIGSESRYWRVSGRDQNYLRFKQDGSTRNQNGRLTYCLRKRNDIQARQIIMYRTGRARKASKDEAQRTCS